jgi:O-antigen/teichoic acid export membrane protein
MDAKKGVAHLLSGNIVGRAITFALNIGLSRTLGPASLGLFGFCLAAAQAFELIARFGIDYGMQCALTSKEITEGANNQGADISKSAMNSVDVITVLLSAGLLIWIFPFQGLIPADNSSSRNLVAITTVAICSLEGFTSLSWEVFLVMGKTKLYALRTAVLAPLRLVAALAGAQAGGISGALMSYASMSGVQMLFIRRHVTRLANHKQAKAKLQHSADLIKSGLPFYLTNAINSAVFLPLLASVAASSGLAEIGYLRIGQLLVQLFTLLPGALAPILFIKLRTSKASTDQSNSLDLALRGLWVVGLFTLIIYILLDRIIIAALFGDAFLPSLIPTRALILAAVLDSASQVLHTNVLAKQRMRFYSATQISSSLLAAATGAWLIPSIGLTGFIIAKLTYSWIPLILYFIDAFATMKSKLPSIGLIASTVLLMPICIDGEVHASYKLWIISLVFIFILQQAVQLRQNYRQVRA